jgi:NADPH-dependent curcumin reductase CurA
VLTKPANLTFEQAASVPVAAVTALQALRDKGHVQPGRKALVNCASGGVGTFAVQIAKAFGAEVTGVCSTDCRLPPAEASASETSPVCLRSPISQRRRGGRRWPGPGPGRA